MSIFVVDDSNYQKYQDNEAFDSFPVNPQSSCYTAYYQFDSSENYHVIAKCNDFLCFAQFDVYDGCSHKTKSSCENSLFCGYCEGMYGTDDHSYCVPGGSQASYNIQCDKYSHWILFDDEDVAAAVIVIVICCLLLCGCCLGICFLASNKRNKKGSVHKKQATIMMVPMQQGVNQSQQQPQMMQPSMMQQQPQMQPMYNNDGTIVEPIIQPVNHGKVPDVGIV
eukprot:TRINITY_DN7165_c0_g1_i1.p1 TRINITY_DN7165_c0_g1~~TRINITY_DN7165_c0_g1_i1.p1  ORF type:complete len:223 (-),score=44.90 TRINITY_DN7165_c0_g1_i1:355-1023(-)